MDIEIELLHKCDFNVDNDLIIDLINKVYSSSEGDLFDKNFERINKEDFENKVAPTLLIAYNKNDKSDKKEIIGCIKASTSSNDNIGEWGTFAVDPKYQGKGYGSQLIKAAENHLYNIKKVNSICVELLSPIEWQHDHKERLRKWYQKLGYNLNDSCTLTFNKGEMLFEGCERMRLGHNCEFKVYEKKQQCII